MALQGFLLSMFHFTAPAIRVGHREEKNSATQ